MIEGLQGLAGKVRAGEQRQPPENTLLRAHRTDTGDLQLSVRFTDADWIDFRAFCRLHYPNLSTAGDLGAALLDWYHLRKAGRRLVDVKDTGA